MWPYTSVPRVVHHQTTLVTRKLVISGFPACTFSKFRDRHETGPRRGTRREQRIRVMASPAGQRGNRCVNPFILFLQLHCHLRFAPSAGSASCDKKLCHQGALTFLSSFSGVEFNANRAIEYTGESRRTASGVSTTAVRK